MAKPVVVVSEGGIPVTETGTEYGTPMTPGDTTTYPLLGGTAVTIVSDWGLPVILVNDDNTPWTP